MILFGSQTQYPYNSKGVIPYMSLSEEDTESPATHRVSNDVGDPELRSYVAFQDEPGLIY